MSAENGMSAAPVERLVITTAEAVQVMHKGTSDAKAFLTLACDQPKGSPLWEEMRQAALDALSWANDDDVIDALYDADMREMES